MSNLVENGKRGQSHFSRRKNFSYKPLIYALSSTRDSDTYHNIKVTIEERSIIFADVVSLSLNQNLHLKNFPKQKKMLNPIFYWHGSYFKLGKYVGDRKK